MEVIKIFELLFQQKVRYLICGGLAMNIYGIPRMTADIDLLLDFEKENLQKFENIMLQLGYKSLIPESISSLHDQTKRNFLMETKNLIAFSFFNHQTNQMSIDVLIKTGKQFDDMFQKRVERNSGNSKIYLTSPEDLIFLKERAGRDQDKLDIEMIKKYVSK